MDLRFTADEERFRGEVRAWLEERLSGAFAHLRGVGGPGDETAALDDRLAWERELEPDMDRVNPNGGAIALGHPVGASGARVVLHLCHLLEQNNANRGLASLCIGGGQGGAMMLERDSA